MEPLDTFKITIDPQYSTDGEDLGIDQIAFTANPAVKIKGMAFKSQEKLSFADEVKMRIVSPAMIPMNIYRRDEMGEYYVQFTQQEIERIHQKFMQNLNNRDKFNLEHDGNEIAPAYVLECWLVGKDNKADRSYSEFGIEVPEGTLMMVSQITDKEYYTKLVANDQTGFSIEGFLGLKLSDQEQTNKKQIMNENLVLPDGEHTIGEKIYVVKDGQVVEIKDVIKAAEADKVACEDVPAEPEAETPEETAAPTEEKPEEVKMAVTPEEVMAVVQPKLDELYGVIADLKALVEGQVNHEQTEIEAEPVQMSAHVAFAEAIKFANKN